MSRTGYMMLIMMGGFLFGLPPFGLASFGAAQITTPAQDKVPVPIQERQTRAFPLPPGSPLTSENWLRVAPVADWVVTGVIREVSSYYGTSRHGFELILSDLRLEVTKVLQGQPVGQLTFTVEGGTVGEMTVHVSSTPELEVGATYLLLLQRDQQGRLWLFGTNFGALPVAEGDAVDALGIRLETLYQALGHAQ